VPRPLVVVPASVAPQPWRNGRGTTRELAVGDGWRVSLADLTEDGPFSVFPGTDRLFTPLADGFELVVDGTPVEARRHRPVAFPGEVDVFLRGLTAPAQALNVMTDRRTWRGVVSVRAAGERLSRHADHYVRPSDVAVRVLLGGHVADICFLPVRSHP